LLPCVPPGGSPQKIAFDKPAGDLPVGTEEDRDAEIYSDRQSAGENRMGVSATAKPRCKDVPQVGFDYNAGVLMMLETSQFAVKARSGTDDGSHKIFERLSLYSHRSLETRDRVVPGR
jgi:hypothetical protein